MNLDKLNIKDLAALKMHLQSRRKTLYVGSATSTVIPFGTLPEDAQMTLADLSQLPAQLSFDEDHTLEIQGAVSWSEAQAFCLAHGRSIKSWPTEQSALVLSGLATAATGERSFGHGSLRQQVRTIEYLDCKGSEHTLYADRLLQTHPLFNDSSSQELLARYQASYESYQNFKNAPFPRLKYETDLMIGFEGQLGVITKARLETCAQTPQAYLVAKLPSWRQDLQAHLEIFYCVQNLRSKMSACEFIDAQAMSELPKDVWPYTGHDMIYFEMDEELLEDIFEILLRECPSLAPEDFFQVDESKIRHLRLGVPRLVSELNARRQVTKLGTDIQMPPADFEKLLKYYQQMAATPVSSVLFGHFGDAHLHFNYLATAAQKEECQRQLAQLYVEVKKWRGSPFAEHGIGLLKAPYIRPFYNQVQFEMFAYLKSQWDPHHQFFPLGFMSLRSE